MLESIKSSVSGFFHKSVPELVTRLYQRLNKRVRISAEVNPQLRKAPLTETGPSDTSIRARKVVKTKENKAQKKARQSFNKLMLYMLEGDSRKAAKGLIELQKKMVVWSHQRSKEVSGDGIAEYRKLLGTLCSDFIKNNAMTPQVREALARGGNAYNTLGALLFFTAGEQEGVPIYGQFHASVMPVIAATQPLYDELFEQFYPDTQACLALKNALYDDTDKTTPNISHDLIREAYQVFKLAR